MKTNNEVKTAFNNGTSATANNLYTDGIRLISYRTIVAKHHPNGVTLKTSRWYSNTTAHHLSGIVATYEVPNLNPTTSGDHRANVAYLVDLWQGYKAKAGKARKAETRARYTEQANRYQEQAKTYCEAFNC